MAAIRYVAVCRVAAHKHEDKMTTTKQCSACKALKDAACFGSDASRSDGREHRCRACISRKNRVAYRKRRGALGATYRARGRQVMTNENLLFSTKDQSQN